MNKYLPLLFALPSLLPGHDLFTDEVWPKVLSSKCLKCHKAGGDAGDSPFIMEDPALDGSEGKAASWAKNAKEFASVAKLRTKDGKNWLVLEKVLKRVPHEGGAVLKEGGERYRILKEYVYSANGVPLPTMETRTNVTMESSGPFFDGIRMIEDPGLVRRLALSLAGRLPTKEELASAKAGGLDAVENALDGIMREDAFYERLAEGFNDIFLTRGYDGVAENALSYDHFNKTRHWYQKYDLTDKGDEKQQERARWKLADVYRESMLREPMELVKRIVRDDRPFTEIITADYIMMSPYTSRGYGMFDEVKGRFKDQEDPFEYIPVRLNALKSRDGQRDQKSETGFYPHAGIMGSFQYLMRYPTTETNRNRLRARMYYQHFLGVDVLELAPRVSDAAAITGKYEVPTMEASECVVCHKTLDPLAGLFQEYYVVDGKGVYGKRKEGWFKDMFRAGFEGEDLPGTENWRSLQWLGEKTAGDPRFAVAMTEHVYYILTGRKVLREPTDLDDPLHSAKHRAWREQRKEVEAIAKDFAGCGFNLKSAFKAWAKSKFYRADGLATAMENPSRAAELEDVGLVRMLAPEQLERKLAAIFGEPWGRLEEQFKILYGGIDSKAVTERISEPSGAMGAIQRMMANEMACRHSTPDFQKPTAERKLFPGIEPGVLPGKTKEADLQIRHAIVHLHEQLLGRHDDPMGDEVGRTFGLFSGILADAQAQGRYEQVDSYHCGRVNEKRVPDPDYSLRAWRGVVTYLLRQQEFLYE